MKILYFDPISGASGDMILGSLIDLGADLNLIKEKLEQKLNVFIKCSTVTKCRIKSVKIDVIDNTNTNKKVKFNELLYKINQLDLSNEVKNWTIKILYILGNAESKIHNIPLNNLHLHEVGQNDALVDIIGTCMALDQVIRKYNINISNILSNNINIGNGVIKYSHGISSVPAPSTLEILKNSNIKYYEDSNVNNIELLTPTGASILSFFSNNQLFDLESFKKEPKKLVGFGYGSGKYNLNIPNVIGVYIYDINLRSLKSKKLSEKNIEDDVEILETNIDNCTGEILGNVITKLILKGAKDAYAIPMIMKKGRPGYLLSVISNTSNSNDLAILLMKETGSLGVRIINMSHRIIANRTFQTISFT